ncbi:MAG: hypothetical protein ACFFA0_05710 [Promethearchaeota archaeon]
MPKIELRCPICSKWDLIEISYNAPKETKKGLTAVNIKAGMICEHSFIAYIDKNLMVRDCLIADFKIEVPESSRVERIGENVVPEAKLINKDIIKLNVPPIFMASVFKASFLGKTVILILNDQFLANHIIHFFKYAMNNLFNINIFSIPKTEYIDNKEKYSNYIIFERTEVIQDKNEILNPKNLKFEKSIAKKFLDEYDLVTGLIILRNEIQKAFEFSKTLADFIENSKDKAYNPKILINHIKEIYNERIHKDYLMFLLNIVNHYFKIEVSKIDGVSNFLEFL